MNNTFYALLCASLFFGGCATAATTQQNAATNINMNTKSSPSATPKTTMSAPSAEDVQAITGKVSGKFNLKNTQTTSLDKQPPEIIGALADSFGKSKDATGNWAAKVSIISGESDFNNDNVPERMIIVLTDANGNTTKPEIKIFSLNKEKWSCLNCSLLVYAADDIEFVPSKKPGEFGAIKITTEELDEETEEPIKLVYEYRVKNGNYEAVSCRELKNGKEKIVPCEPD